jgi:uncharacterized protein (TIGR02246 family)
MRRVFQGFSALLAAQPTKRLSSLPLPGASLKDPNRLFNSSLEGNMRRAIDISEGEIADAASFKALVRQAITPGQIPMRTTLHSVLLAALITPTIVAAADSTNHAADEAAIKAVIAEHFMAGWNGHDAHLFASAFASDADFTNVRGMNASGRENIEQFHVQAFQKMFMQSHQTGELKQIRFLKPDVAVVDVRWEMTGALTPDGAASPPRSGLLDLVFTATGGNWLITVMHNIELTPTAPASSTGK